MILTRDIKAAYGLTMDQAEAREMTRWLEYCSEGGLETPGADTTPTMYHGADHDGTHRPGKCAGY